MHLRVRVRVHIALLSERAVGLGHAPAVDFHLAGVHGAAGLHVRGVLRAAGVELRAHVAAFRARSRLYTSVCPVLLGQLAQNRLLSVRFLLLAVRRGFRVLFQAFIVDLTLQGVELRLPVVDAPVERPDRRRRVLRRVKALEKGVFQALLHRRALPGVEDEHALQQVDALRRAAREVLLEVLARLLGQFLDLTLGALVADEAEVIRAGRAQQVDDAVHLV